MRERGVIGGSAITAIVGKSPYDSPFDVWAELTGKLPDRVAAEHMSLGALLEGPILAEYAKRENATDLVPMFDKLVVHPDRPWQTGHPDGDRPEAGITPEAKYVPFGAAKYGEAGTDQVPQEHLIQSIWYQSLMGRRAGHLVALLPGELKIFVIHFNQRLADFLLEKAHRFYVDHVLADIPPPMSATPTTARFLRHNFPTDVEPLRVARLDEMAMARDLAALRAEVDRLQHDADITENILKLTIGNAAGITANDFKITYKKSKDKTKTDWQAAFTELRNDLALEGDLNTLAALDGAVAKYTVTTPGSRRFTPSGPIFKEEK